MANSGIVRMEMLTKDNFDTWKIHMRALLIKNDAWRYVNGTKIKPEENVAEITAWNDQDSKAMSDIILAIHPSELKQIKDCTTSREVWQKLETIYQSKGPARKATLLKQIVLQRMRENDDVRDHLRIFFDAVDKLKDMEVTINDDLLSILLLYSLPSTFENFRCAMESRDELPAPDALRIKIIEESDARRGSGRNVIQNAMAADFRKNKNGKSKEKSERREQDGDKDKKVFRCYKCKKIGHKANECRSYRKDDQNRPNQRDQSSLYVAPASNSCNLVRAKNDAMDKKWCLDSGCTSHLCKDRENFSFLEPNVSGKLNLANFSSTDIGAKGIAKFSTRVNGRDRLIDLNDALYVPDLRTNLLSVGKIVDKGFRVTFEEKSAQVTDADGRTILHADRVDGLYFVQEKRANEQGNVASPENSRKGSLEKWHRKMGHLNIKDLRDVFKKGAIRGLDIQNVNAEVNCECCLQGKMSRKPFPKKSERITKPGELIHTDVCGPMRTPSNGNARYFVTFIDDATRWCEVRFLRQKSETYAAFVAYKNMIETAHGRKIKYVQSDNGTEYVNHQFDELFEQSGIQRRLTVPNNPEQNGVAERKNRSLVETARCLLIGSKLTATFWAEAVSTANYIRNRCPTNKLEGRTPYEAWLGQLPDVGNFEEFGCSVYCLNRTNSPGKFEPRARKGIFLGYAEDSKAYRIWIPDERKVEISRDIKVYQKDQSDIDQDNEPSRTDLDFFDVQLTSQNPEVAEENQIPDSLDIAEDTENSVGDSDVDDLEDGFKGFEQPIPEVREEVPVPATKRGPGRPTTIRTGRPGRPRKKYASTEDQPMEQAEMVYLAEIPIHSAINSSDADEWKLAMANEFASILKNDTWDVVNRPEDQATIGSRLVLRNKHGADGQVTKRKARVVAKGYSQRPGTDFGETYAPVARLASIRVAVAIAAQYGMKIRQFDVTTAYLNGVIDEKIYMEVPEYTEDALKYIVRRRCASTAVIDKAKQMLAELSTGNKVCLIKKSLYGLRQAGRCWYRRLSEELLKIGVKPTQGDACVYVNGKGKDMLIVVVYVDDILIISQSSKEIDNVYDRLRKSFEINDMGDVKYCLGIEFSRNSSGIEMSQKNYILDILHRFEMSSCKPVSTPIDPGLKLTSADVWSPDDGVKPPYRELVGALMYLSVATRPDVSHAASMLSQYNDSFGKTHWQAAKRVLRYLKGTVDVRIKYGSGSSSLTGYVDADWAASVDDRRSYTGFVFTLGGGPISWESRKQRTVALSSTEAEYMALSEASKEAIHLRHQINDIENLELPATKLFVDNLGAKKLAENPIHHSRTKHIQVRHHFVREVLQAGEIQLDHMSTKEMPADVLTKGLPKGKHWECLKSLGISRGCHQQE